MSSLAYRWIVPGILAVVFMGLILLLGSQQARSWNEFETSIVATLRIEARARAVWLSERLDPFASYSDWTRQNSDLFLPDLTGAAWLLLDASGEVAFNRRGEILYAEPESATSEVEWKVDEASFQSALAGEETVGPAHRTGRTYRKRVFIPVEVASGAISTRWILVGQVGQGSVEDTLFGQIFQAQRRFYWTATPLALASMLFLALLFRGIARTSRLERSLREAEESIELESLTSTLAHELRNPLAIVQSCAEIIQRQESLSEDGKGLLVDLIEELRRAQDVLTQHLHPGQSETNTIDDIAGFSKQFWDHRRSLLATHGLTLNLELLPSDEPIRIHAVPDRLERILDNLLRNSMEAMPNGGMIRYQLRAERESVEILFEDSGPGLRKMPFFSREGWKVGSTKPQGRGIGLRLARKWLAPWGATLTARNRRSGPLGPIKGARLVLRFAREK